MARPLSATVFTKFLVDMYSIVFLPITLPKQLYHTSSKSSSLSNTGHKEAVLCTLTVGWPVCHAL